jgi:Ca2+-binding EF-hand superfamily protein
MRVIAQRKLTWGENACSIKDRLRRSFADRANDFTLTLSTLSAALSGLEGEVEDQLRHVQRLRDEALPPLAAFLDTIAELDARCAEARIEENDYTTYTLDELCYEFGLVQSGVAKKHAFLENQLVARSMTNLTPIQLEEFESVFRHFDRGLRNALSEIEFRAALASLGLVYDEHEMRSVFRQATTSGGSGSSSGSGGGGGSGDYVTFEQFIRFMVAVTEDQNTAEQVFQSFREVADGKVCFNKAPPPPTFPLLLFLSFLPFFFFFARAFFFPFSPAGFR